MTILEKGSLLRLHQTANILGGTKQEVQGGSEENAKISTYWILIVLDFNKNHTKIISNLSAFAKRHAFGDDLICYCCLVRIPIFKIDPYLSSRRSSPISLEFYYIDPQDCKKGTYQPGTCLAIGMPIYDVLPVIVSPGFQEKMMAVTMQSFSLEMATVLEGYSTEWHTSKDVQSLKGVANLPLFRAHFSTWHVLKMAAALIR